MSGVVGGKRVLEEREDFFLDGEFPGITKFESVTGENLDAVVGPGIV